MGNKIIVCGGNGAGKSTLGRILANRLNCRFLDIEDYYFPEPEADYPYGTVRTREEVCRMLPGGDLYEQESVFFDLVSQRPEQDGADWLRTTSIPAIPVDGTQAIEDNIDFILRRLAGLGRGGSIKFPLDTSPKSCYTLS